MRRGAASVVLLFSRLAPALAFALPLSAPAASNRRFDSDASRLVEALVAPVSAPAAFSSCDRGWSFDSDESRFVLACVAPFSAPTAFSPRGCSVLGADGAAGALLTAV